MMIVFIGERRSDGNARDWFALELQPSGLGAVAIRDWLADCDHGAFSHTETAPFGSIVSRTMA